MKGEIGATREDPSPAYSLLLAAGIQWLKIRRLLLITPHLRRSLFAWEKILGRLRSACQLIRPADRVPEFGASPVRQVRFHDQ